MDLIHWALIILAMISSWISYYVVAKYERLIKHQKIIIRLLESELERRK